MVERQDPDNFTRFKTRESCALEIAAYVFNSRFTRNQILIMSFLGFKKAELGCKMSELHLYVVKGRTGLS